MSKDNKKVSQKTVTKKSKKELELEQKELKRILEKLNQESKKHVREWMEAGLKVFGEKKPEMVFDINKFLKFLKYLK